VRGDLDRAATDPEQAGETHCPPLDPPRVGAVQLPTALEQGLPDVDADDWNAFFFPKGTPDPIVRRLNAAISKALDNPALSVRMEELGLTVPPPDRRSPEHLAELVRMEIGKWALPIKASGFSAD
jgi:tripartite-type tricarboxylate transporter receptor subunit TctC